MNATRVLVIEDNRDAADSLRELLEWLGCSVVVSYTGRDGIQAARRFHPNIVVCDLGLPGVDGYEVARCLRQDEELGTTRLIALTGYGSKEMREMALQVGFNDYLVKPARAPQLLKLIFDAPSKP